MNPATTSHYTASEPSAPPGMLRRWSGVLDLAGPGRGLRRWAVDAGRLAARALARGAIRPARRGAWMELEASLTAFQIVKRAEVTPGHRGLELDDPGSNDSLSLLQAVVRRRGGARELDPTRALWAVEGLGLALGSRALRATGGLATALRPIAEPVSVTQKLALQAGLAMACALHVLAGDGLLAGDGPPCRAAAFLERMAQVMPAAGRARAVEAFGMVARLQFQEQIADLDGALAATDPALVAPFWHGVGRGLYFSFPHAFDGGDRWRAMEQVHAEPPHAEARRNALNGFAWPWLLVNLHQPRWICAALARHHRRIVDFEAFSAGAACALLVRRAWGGRMDEPLARLLDHRPPAAVRTVWEDHIVGPARPLLERCCELLLRHRQFSVLFQYQQLCRLPELLSATPGGGDPGTLESHV